MKIRKYTIKLVYHCIVAHNTMCNTYRFKKNIYLPHAEASLPAKKEMVIIKHMLAWCYL